VSVCLVSCEKPSMTTQVYAYSAVQPPTRVGSTSLDPVDIGCYPCALATHLALNDVLNQFAQTSTLRGESVWIATQTSLQWISRPQVLTQSVTTPVIQKGQVGKWPSSLLVCSFHVPYNHSSNQCRYKLVYFADQTVSRILQMDQMQAHNAVRYRNGQILTKLEMPVVQSKRTFRAYCGILRTVTNEVDPR